MHPISCTNNTHCDVTDLVNHGMVKNTKIYISSEQNITFYEIKKNSKPVPQMTHLEKLSFCSGGNL